MSSSLGLGTLLEAFSSITSSKWADTRINARIAVTADVCPEQSSDSSDSSSSDSGDSSPQASDRTVDGRITWAAVQRRCSQQECWIVVRNKVYDVTEFVPLHPGGSAILAYGGRDASDVFAAFHASSTWSKLRQFYIGDVEHAQPDPMLEDFRRLRARMKRDGLFHSSKAFYVWKTVSLLGLYSTVATILLHAQDTWLGCLAAAFMLALCWQQTGWLSHDFLHHQVFRNRTLNTAFGYFQGNLLQGFSVDWWKNKHNKHHAVPNECDDRAQAVDPDIDTLPLLAWHEDMLTTLSPELRPLLRHQHWFMVPIMCLARFSWAQQSLLHARVLSKVSTRGVLEVALLAAHYAIFAGLPLLVLSPAKAVTFFALAEVLAGFMLAIVFVQSHNGMEVYSDRKDFVSAQLVSTRNISASPWMDWFSGGLNYQIEHHLFPTLPRHNLPRAQQLVRRFCAEHQFEYESCGMDAGTYRVLSRLASVAEKAA